MSQIQMMALRHSAFYSPYLLTIAGGFLKEEGLEPVYRVETPGDTVVDNIQVGRCHVSQSAVAASFVMAEKGVQNEIVHFAQLNQKDGFFIAAREPDPDFNWHKLIGKKVLVDHFFQPYAMLSYGLSKQGIQLSQFEVVDAGDVQAMDKAFRAGEGDYVHQQGPAPQQMESEGLAYVVAAVGDAVGPVAFSSVCASHDWLQTEMAQAFLRAYTKSMAFVISSPAEEIAALEQEAGFFPDIDRIVLINTIRGYQQLGCWDRDVNISEASYKNLINVFNFNKTLSRDYAFNEFVVNLGS